MGKAIIFLAVLFLASSCVTTDKCSIKINKSKADYYNKIQFGSGKTYVKKKRR